MTHHIPALPAAVGESQTRALYDEVRTLLRANAELQRECERLRERSGTLTNRNEMDASKLSQVWAIRHPAGHLVPPIDDDASDSFLAWPTREQAEIGLKAQLAKGYIEEGEVFCVS